MELWLGRVVGFPAGPTVLSTVFFPFSERKRILLGTDRAAGFGISTVGFEVWV